MKIHPSLAQEEAPFVTDAEAKQLFDQIMALYPDPQPTLHAEDPFQILVAVMLSAQTTVGLIRIFHLPSICRSAKQRALTAASALPYVLPGR